MIDVHAHFVPDGYRAALVANGHAEPDGFPQIPEWSAQEHVAMMDRHGIATSLLSISSPGVHVGDLATTRELAREVNENGRRAIVDHPGRFGQSRLCRCPISTPRSPRSSTASVISTLRVSYCSRTSTVCTSVILHSNRCSGRSTRIALACSSIRRRRRVGNTHRSAGRAR
jgi:hypothetical protein